ncbi:MAG: class II aldolase/adducin family protein [Chloroflexota bacterium]|nr:class II aldolase/adducin family protein [Chloroflexota bacterium]
MTNNTNDTLKEQLVQAARLLFQAGVMSHSGHGNMSARLPGTEHMLLASTSLHAELTSEQVAIVSFDGEVIEGTLEAATREIVPMHAGVYRVRADVGSVMHTHSPRVTSFALAHQPLPCAYEAMLRFGITEEIPVAAWAPRGSQASVTNIVEQIERAPASQAVLLANHGLLAFARDSLATAQLIIIMEEAAEMTLAARELGGEKGFPGDALEKEQEHMRRFGSTRS